MIDICMSLAVELKTHFIFFSLQIFVQTVVNYEHFSLER